MSLGGLAGSAALLKDKLREKPCERCGLAYDRGKHEHCPHCGELDELGLAQLKARVEREHAGNKELGRRFLVVAVLLFVLLTVLAVA